MEESMENGLISVVMPTYNRAGTILQSISSIQRQTYRNIEIIVVDDGSADQTEKVVRKIRDDRLRYFRYDENRGACYARNYGADQAGGEYLAFQDSDDLWDERKLEKQLAFITGTGADFVFCGMERTERAQGRSFYYPSCGFDNAKDPLLQLLVENAVSTQTVLMKKQLWGTIRFDRSFRRFQDWDFALQAAGAGCRIAYQEEALATSEVLPDSISAVIKEGEAFEHILKKYEALYSRYPAIRAEMYKRTGNAYRKADRKKAEGYYRKSLKCRVRWKTLLRLLFLYLRRS